MLIFPYVYPDLEPDLFDKMQLYVVGFFLAVLYSTMLLCTVIIAAKMIKNRKKLPNKEEKEQNIVIGGGASLEDLRDKWLNGPQKEGEVGGKNEKEFEGLDEVDPNETQQMLDGKMVGEQNQQKGKGVVNLK
jgi:hypothetical protein